MNPHDFQIAFLAWLAVVLALASPVIHAIFAIKKAWNDEKEKAELQTQLALQKQQTEQNTARLNGQSAKIDTLLIQATPPNQSPTVVAVPVLEPQTQTPCPEDGQKDQAS